MRPVLSLPPLPDSLVLTFYVLIGWGLTALFSAFRTLAGESVNKAILLRVVLAVWLGIPALLAGEDVYRELGTQPPYLFRTILPMLALVVGVCFSPWGKVAAEKLPASLLIGTQAFRFPLELLLYVLFTHHALSREMTMAGYNFDIITGITALPLWWKVRRLTAPNWMLWAWNCLGMALLLTVMTIAILGFPEPFGWFSPPNKAVAFFPWVWLPTFLVPIALASHLLLFRKLSLPPSPPRPNI